jgi:uncharacterized protein (TIGR00730 family)
VATDASREQRLTTICVFCGSSDGGRPEYGKAAGALGEAVAARDLTLVYGGSNIGMMRRLADAALEAGGRVIGVIPEQLVEWERAHRGLTELHVVASMHERKALMVRLSDAFIALPGGVGTLDEFFEVLTWAQLGLHQKPCALLNVEGYFDSLLEMFERARRDGFLYGVGTGAVPLVDNEPERLLDRVIARSATSSLSTTGAESL